MGAQKFKGKVNVALLSQGASDLRWADVALTNADIKALRATPKTLVPAPGTGKVIEFLSAVLMLKAGTNVLTEATANLAVRYKDGAGVQVSQTIETTGFIDQAADQITYGLQKLDRSRRGRRARTSPSCCTTWGQAKSRATPRTTPR